MSQTQGPSRPAGEHHRPAHAARGSEAPDPAQQIELRVAVPLLDEPEPGRIVYRPAMLHSALVGALLGAFVLAATAWVVAAGPWPIAGLGQFAAGGVPVATVTGAGAGVALGALVGALSALYRTPAYRREG